MNIKIKYLEMIQNIINRMGSNSFRLKELTVTLMAGIFVLFDKRAEFMFCIVACIPIITFWILDSYYLSRERLYRELYNKVRKMEIKSPNVFSMAISQMSFQSKCKFLLNCVISRSELLYYMPLMLIPIFVCFVSKHS